MLSLALALVRPRSILRLFGSPELPLVFWAAPSLRDYRQLRVLASDPKNFLLGSSPGYF